MRYDHKRAFVPIGDLPGFLFLRSRSALATRQMNPPTGFSLSQLRRIFEMAGSDSICFGFATALSLSLLSQAFFLQQFCCRIFVRHLVPIVFSTDFHRGSIAKLFLADSCVFVSIGGVFLPDFRAENFLSQPGDSLGREAGAGPVVSLGDTVVL